MKTIYNSLLIILLVWMYQSANAQCAGVNITMNIISQNNVSCNGGNDGQIIVEGVGGASPYTFDWSPISVQNDTVNNMTAGMYIVTITDNNGCDSTDTVFITEPSVLDVTAVATPATCGSADGTATAFPSGGVGPYSYSWSPYGGNNQVATGLVQLPGGYTVTVTDNNGCVDLYNVMVPAVGGPSVTLTGLTNVSCNGGNDGFISVTAGGGSGPYTFEWQPGGMTGDTLTDLEAGNYEVTVWDASGCSNSMTVTVSQPNVLNAYQGATTQAACGSNNGSAQVNVTGGTSPYTYAWSTGGINSLETNLSAGVYFVMVTDDKGCQDSVQIGIANTTGPTVGLNSMQDVSCYGNSDGSIEIDASGGAGSYSYQWIPFGGNAALATNLPGGSYTVIVTDGAGCVGILSQDLFEPDEIVITATVVKEDCAEFNGAVYAQASGGAGGITYSWNTGATSTFIQDLMHGTYILTVTDWTGCSVSQSYDVTIEGNIPVTATIDQSLVFAGEEVTLTATAEAPGTPPFDYIWDPDYTLSCTNCQTATANPLVDTFWVVTAIDANDCWGTDTVWITMKEPCRELMVPTIFSPNSDGLNDNLCILGTCLEQMELMVYNRWGNLVFRSIDQSICWDGTINGKPAMSGIYAFKFHGVLYDGTTIDEEGKLTLVR